MTIAEAAKGFGDGAANADPQPPVESSRRTVTLREACRLFAEHGYSRTTIREIAAAVGIQSGSLFYHFPTKEHILAAIIMESTLSGLAVARSFIAQAHSPVERFEALIRAHLSVLLEEHTGNAQRVSIREWKRLPPELRQPIEKLTDEYRALWWEIMGELEAAGLLGVSKNIFYHFCIGGLNWTASWYNPSTGVTMDDLVKNYVAMLRFGMKGHRD